LIELCRHPEVQEKLREEVNQLGGDPTWEQITLGLPYLDAVTQEVLRMHMPVDNILREVNHLPGLPYLHFLISPDERF
jgi:cytochrome P450